MKSKYTASPAARTINEVYQRRVRLMKVMRWPHGMVLKPDRGRATHLIDNTSNQLPVALPLFDQYGFKVTLYIGD